MGTVHYMYMYIASVPKVSTCSTLHVGKQRGCLATWLHYVIMISTTQVGHTRRGFRILTGSSGGRLARLLLLLLLFPSPPPDPNPVCVAGKLWELRRATYCVLCISYLGGTTAWSMSHMSFALT